VSADCVTAGKLQENNYIVLLDSLARKYPALRLANLLLQPGEAESSTKKFLMIKSLEVLQQQSQFFRRQRAAANAKNRGDDL
jgi:hypothetical protein